MQMETLNKWNNFHYNSKGGEGLVREDVDFPTLGFISSEQYNTLKICEVTEMCVIERPDEL